MAVNVWSSVGSTDGNLVSNWSLGALTSADTLTYNGTSVVNCTFTAGVSCAAMTTTVAYTGILKDGGQTITVAGAVNITLNTGQFRASGTWNCSGSWTFSGGTVSCSYTNVVNFLNTATITSNGRAFYGVVFNASGKNITLGDFLFCNSYTLTAGTLTLAGYKIFQASTCNVWIATSNSTYNTDGNWSLGHVPTSAEDVLFISSATNLTSATSGSSYGCTVGVSAACSGIGFIGAYNGNVSLSGYGITLGDGLADYGSGTRNLGNYLTMNGTSATLHLDATLGTVTATSCGVSMNGTSQVLDDDKGTTFKSLTLGASAKVTATSNSSTTFSGATTVFIMGNSSTLTNNAGDYLNFTPTADQTVFSFGAGCTFNGSTGWKLNNGGATTITIPAVTWTGSSAASLYFGSVITSSTTFTLSGALNFGISDFHIYNASSVATRSVTFNSSDLSITSGNLSVGSNGTQNSTFNFGASIVTLSSFFNSSNYNNATATQTVNFSTSQFTCGKDWTMRSNHTVSGSFLITFNGTINQSITSNGKSFYDITINRTTATTNLNFADAISLHSFTVSATNTQVVSWTGMTMTASGNITIDGTGTHIFGNGVTLTGASSIFHIGSTLTAPTATSCALTFTGATAPVLDDDIGTTFKTLTVGTAALAVLTSSGAATTTFSHTATPITFFAGSTVTFTAPMIVSCGGSITVFSIGAGTTFNGAGAITIQPSANTLTITIPAITYTGSGVWSMISGGFTPTVYSLSGALNIGTTNLSVYTAVATKNVTFTPAGYSVTCGALAWGTGNSGTFTLTGSASAFSITSYVNTYDSALGTSTIALLTSTFTCSGNWTWGLNHTITGTAASQIVNFTGAETTTSNGKSFPGSVVINSPAATRTLADAIITGYALTLTAGTLNTATFGVTVGQDFSVNGTSTFTGTSSVISVAGNITVASGSTFTIGSAQITTTGTTPTITTGAKAFPYLILTKGAVFVGGSTIARLKMTTGYTYTLASTSTYTISSYTAGDWNGASLASYVTVRASAAGSQAIIVAPAGIHVAFTDWKDVNNTGTVIDAKTSSNTDSGNNLNIDFNVIVLSITPTSGLKNTMATISGVSFLPVQSTGHVEFVTPTATLAATVSAWSDTSIVVYVPNGKGLSNVKVYSSDGDIGTLSGGFTIIKKGDVVINTTIDGSVVSLLRTNIDGSQYYPVYVKGTNLMVDRKYYDGSNNIIGTAASVA